MSENKEKTFEGDVQPSVDGTTGAKAEETIELVHAYTEEQKREVRKYVDMRLMPLLCISYGLQVSLDSPTMFPNMC